MRLPLNALYWREINKTEVKWNTKCIVNTTEAYIYFCGYSALKNHSFTFTCHVWAVIVDAGVCEIVTEPFIAVGRRRRAPQRSHFSILIFFHGFDIFDVFWFVHKWEILSIDKITAGTHEESRRFNKNKNASRYLTPRPPVTITIPRFNVANQSPKADRKMQNWLILIQSKNIWVPVIDLSVTSLLSNIDHRLNIVC